MTQRRATEQQLGEEARKWDTGELTPKGWEDATDTIPRAEESVSISIRIPQAMLTILKEFAKRDGIGYQVLMKRWLDKRIGEERERLFPATRVRLTKPEMIKKASSFVVSDDDRVSGKASVDEIGIVAERIATIKQE